MRQLLLFSLALINADLLDLLPCRSYIPQDTANLTSFDLTAYGNYTGTGFHTSKFIYPAIAPNATVPLNPVVWALDATNQRLFINHTVNVHYFFKNYSLFFVPQFQSCFFRPDYNFTTHVKNYAALSDIGPGLFREGVGEIKTYTGTIHDQHVCPETRIGVLVEQNQCGALTRWAWSQPLTIQGGRFIGVFTQTLWLNTLKKENPANSLFDPTVIPQCRNPVSFYPFFNCSSTSQIN